MRLPRSGARGSGAAKLPAIEIDIGSVGVTITRDALADLVVSETGAKRWLHQPDTAQAADLLYAQLDEKGAQQG